MPSFRAGPEQAAAELCPFNQRTYLLYDKTRRWRDGTGPGRGQAHVKIAAPFHPATIMPPRRPLIALLATLTLSSAPALAGDDACALLSPAQLSRLGLSAAVAPNPNTVELGPEQSGAPSALRADLCFHYNGTRGSRHALTVTVETYEKSEGVAEWLERQNQRGAPAEIRVARHGVTTCEQGRYDSNVNLQTGSGARETRVQHYLSCDRLVGARRLGLAVETPGTPAQLPSDATLIEALDAIEARLGR